MKTKLLFLAIGSIIGVVFSLSLIGSITHNNKKSSSNSSELSTSESLSTEHTHTYASTYSFDEQNHWFEATCGHSNEKKDYYPHVWDKGEVTKNPTEEYEGEMTYTCTICKTTKTEPIDNLPHTHKYESNYSYNEEYHWYAASCDHSEEMKDYYPHVFSEWSTTVEPTEDSVGTKQRTCSLCGYVDKDDIAKLPHTHKFETGYSFNEEYHWYAASCEHSEEMKDYYPHVFSEWSTTVEPTEESVGTKQRTCSLCGYVDKDDIAKLPHTHKYETDYSFNETTHWYASSCGHDVIEGQENHTGTFSCEVCGYVASESSGLKYTLSSDGTYYIVSDIGGCVEDNIVIPLTYNNKPVKEIGSNAFEYTNIKDILINENIIKINSYAFKGCTYLTSIYIPNTVTSIGFGAFSGCSGITNMTLPFVGGGTTSNTNFGYIFGTSSYSYSHNYVPSSLKEVIISNGCKIITPNAFSNCVNLTKIIIPDSVISIGLGSFYGCTSLESITIPFVGLNVNENKHLGFIFGANAYSDNHNKVPSSLKEIIIGDACKELASHAFYDCKQIKSIKIGDGVTKIVDTPFALCSGLTSISFGKSVSSINGNMFSSSNVLTNIVVDEDNTTYDSRNNCNAVINKSNNQLVLGGSNTIIPDSVTSIGPGAFYNRTKLTSIIINDNITSIKSYAFSKCSNLASVVLGKGVSSIAYESFIDCTRLSSIIVDKNNSSFDSRNDCNAIINTKTNELRIGCKNTVIPDSVTSIGTYAFQNCTGLESISLGNSLTSIGNYAFSRCSKLTSIIIPNSVTSIGTYAFQNCTGLGSISLGNSLTSIGGYAFSGCSKLTSISIPDSVTSIGSNAFDNCSGLSSIKLGKNVSSIGEKAFSSCKNISSIIVDENNTTYDSRNNCNAIIKKNTDELILGCKNTIIPDGVISISNYVFSNLNELTSISIPNSVTSIGNYAFQNCTGLESVSLGNSLTSIGSYAFYGCSKLTNIIIPESVTSIGTYAFQNCTRLESVSLGSSLTSIDNYTFYGCTKLSSITIPESVTSISNNAFLSCSALTEINYSGTIEQWNAIEKGTSWNDGTGTYTIKCSDGNIEK